MFHQVVLRPACPGGGRLAGLTMTWLTPEGKDTQLDLFPLRLPSISVAGSVSSVWSSGGLCASTCFALRCPHLNQVHFSAFLGGQHSPPPCLLQQAPSQQNRRVFCCPQLLPGTKV